MTRAVPLLAALACGACAPAPRAPETQAAPHTVASPIPTRSPTPTPAPTPLPTPTSTPNATPTPTASACGTGEVSVPPTGDSGFLMGKGLKVGEHRVVLTRAFCMDENETTVREYAECVEAHVCKEPWIGDPFSAYPKLPDHPVNMVSWVDAHTYCAWKGKRLPSEAEWEWAATGPEQSKYPWGDAPGPSCERCDYTHWGAPKWSPGGDYGCGGGGPSKVGTHSLGDKVWPGGHLHDLAGNVWEWVEDSFAPFTSEAATDPVVRNERRIHPLRGGGWNRSYAAMEVTYRAYHPEDYRVPASGFRCVH